MPTVNLREALQDAGIGDEAFPPLAVEMFGLRQILPHRPELDSESPKHRHVFFNDGEAAGGEGRILVEDEQHRHFRPARVFEKRLND